MPVIIPKKLIQKDDLVVIPLKEYEEFLELKVKSIPTVKPTKEELKIIKEGKAAIKRGDYLTLEALEKELGL